MTSIEWFAQEINKINVSTEARLFINKLKDQAKEMHREEIEDSFQDGKWDWSEHITNDIESKDLAQYYQEKFKND